MKKYLLLLLLTIQATAFAQSGDLRARIEFENAEKAFTEENYKDAIEHLTKAENLLGSWNPKIGYLKIMALDNLIAYYEWDSKLDELDKNVKKYLAYAETDSNVDMGKFKDVYNIEERLAEAKKIRDWKKMPEYVSGLTAYESKNYSEALSQYHKAAEKGNLWAMDGISDMYRDGIGVEVDYQKSLEWDTKAAKGGYTISLADIGSMYYYGMGVPVNYDEAREWFNKGIERGDVGAMYCMGILYQYGHGVPQNASEAINWYSKALKKEERGNVLFVLGVVYYEGNGIRQDLRKAIEWWRKSADKGFDYAMTTLGVMYQNGQGVTADANEALKWYKKAVDAGSDIAMNNIGNMYHQGLGVQIDYQEAAKWYVMAAEAGNIVAMSNLGALYNTKTVAPSVTEATKWFEWFNKAYQHDTSNNYHLRQAIADMYRNGIGVAQDKKIARQWEN